MFAHEVLAAVIVGYKLVIGNLKAARLGRRIHAAARRRNERKIMANAITAADFDAIVKSETRPVLVDFWANWCGPCRALGPIVEEIAEEKADTLAVYKCDVDAESALAQRFGIMSIPNIIVFKNGEVAGQIVGAMPKDMLLAQIEKFI